MIGILSCALQVNNWSELWKDQVIVNGLRISEQVIDGKPNKEIAEEVFLSPWTVKTHVNSRAAAVRVAFKQGVI
jgi:DNA-binding CsgD family transcriptional regulator